MKGFFHDVGASSLHPMFKSLRIGLFDHSKSTEFPFRMIVIPMMVLVFPHKTVAGDLIFKNRPGNTLYREMQLRYPGFSGLLIFNVI